MPSLDMIPDKYCQVLAENGFLGLIHELLQDLATTELSPFGEATRNEKLLECAIENYEKETEAKVKGRINASYALETATSETLKEDEPSPQLQLESGVLGEGAGREAEITTPPVVIPIQLGSISEPEINSSHSPRLSRRSRMRKRQKWPKYKSSPNCAIYINDEDSSVISQDTVQTRENELEDNENEVNEIEATSEASNYSDDEVEVSNHSRASYHEALLTVRSMPCETSPAHLTHIVREIKSCEDFLERESFGGQMVSPQTQNNMLVEMIDQNEHTKNAEDILNQNEEQGYRTSNYAETEETMEFEEQHQGKISSQSSSQVLEDNIDAELEGRATHVISHDVAPEDEVAMQENTSGLPFEPQHELDYGHTGNVITLDPSCPAASPTHQLYEGDDQDSVRTPHPSCPAASPTHQLCEGEDQDSVRTQHPPCPAASPTHQLYEGDDQDSVRTPHPPCPAASPTHQLCEGDDQDSVRTPHPPCPAASPTHQLYEGEDQDKFDNSVVEANTIANVTFDMDKLVKLNSWITSRGTDQDEGGQTGHSDATTELEEINVANSLQELNGALVQRPVDKNSEHSLQEVYEANDSLQSIASDIYTDNHREIKEESSMGCETMLLPLDECTQNEEQSNSHFCPSSSEIFRPQLSDQTPTLSIRASSQNSETGRTFVVNRQNDEYLERPHILPCISTVTMSNSPESMLNLEGEHQRPLYSTSPRTKQHCSSEAKLTSHSSTSSMIEVHPVTDQHEVHSSLSLTSVASDASVPLPESDHEKLKSPFRSSKRFSSKPDDDRSVSPSGGKFTTGKLPPIEHPHISPCIRTVTMNNRSESMLNLESEHLSPLYSTSPRPKQHGSNEVKLASLSSTSSMLEVHPVIDQDEVHSSLSHTSVASNASTELLESEHNGLKSPFCSLKRRLSFTPNDRSVLPSGAQCTTGLLPPIERPHISSCISTVTMNNSSESMLNPESRHLRQLYSTSPRPKQHGLSEVKLTSHSSTSSMIEVHPVIDKDELNSSLSHTSAAANASAELPESEHEGLKSPFRSKRRLSFTQDDHTSVSPSSAKCTTVKLPPIQSPPSVSRPTLIEAKKMPSLPPIVESVVVHGSSTLHIQGKGITTQHNTLSLPLLNTSAKENSVACSSQTDILPKSPTKKKMRAQTADSSKCSNGKEGKLLLDGRVIGKPPPSPSPSKTSRRSGSQNVRRT